MDRCNGRTSHSHEIISTISPCPYRAAQPARRRKIAGRGRIKKLGSVLALASPKIIKLDVPPFPFPNPVLLSARAFGVAEGEDTTFYTRFLPGIGLVESVRTFAKKSPMRRVGAIHAVRPFFLPCTTPMIIYCGSSHEYF